MSNVDPAANDRKICTTLASNVSGDDKKMTSLFLMLKMLLKKVINQIYMFISHS